MTGLLGYPPSRHPAFHRTGVPGLQHWPHPPRSSASEVPPDSRKIAAWLIAQSLGPAGLGFHLCPFPTWGRFKKSHLGGCSEP